ncbi:MAG: PhoH family protein [Candidatus Jacksonbacteria bacterium]|jgi:phosphate starvation-inducible PhoH-like protein|nr:PhoH family protein [Candidatus Jacksonbacteria bacterium]
MSSRKKKKALRNGTNLPATTATLGRNKIGLKVLRSIQIKPEFWTRNQELLYNTILEKPLTFTTGPAGTGKTYISALAALMVLRDKKHKIKKVYITKPLVEAGEKLGFLPGGVEEKTDPFMFSFYMNIQKIAGKGVADILLKDQTIEVLPLAYMRGITLENCVAILDETQNSSPQQVKMFLSRLGRNAKLIVSGDERQKDTNLQVDGLSDAVNKLENLDKQIGVVKFQKEDIIRHSLVTKILDAYEEQS